jgi:hypothetical protein
MWKDSNNEKKQIRNLITGKLGYNLVREFINYWKILSETLIKHI